MNKVVFSILLISVASCGLKKNKTVEEVENEVFVTVPDNELSEDIYSSDYYISPERALYHGAENILTDIIHTRLEVSFDWEKSSMNGKAEITAKPYFYPSDSLILDAKGMTINSVKMNGQDLFYHYENDLLKIQLGKVYSRNESYTIQIDYIAHPEDRQTSGSAAITSDKGLYFINPKGEDGQKMPQIWTQGETEASSVWFPTIDSPNTKTSQEIFITVDDKYATLSNGKLISSKKTSDGKRTDHWKQDLPHSPYLFMMGIGEFKVVKDTYKRKDGSTMEVNYYVEPEWEEFADDIFGETPEMIRFFSELTGVEYPWDKYHQIVVRDYVSGAMENTGAVIFGDFVYKNDRELLDQNDQSTIAHELFHHWFGDLVTCESWSNLPLNESFANYSQYLWDEHRFGLDEADYNAEYEADGYYQTAQMQGYHDLIWFDYDDKEQMFDGHSYNKGGRILHMLRNYLGDEAFFAGIKLYLETNKYNAAEFHHLRLAFEEVSGEDLNWFFDQWFLASGHPVLNITQEIDTFTHHVHVTVIQQQNLEMFPIFKLPVEIAIHDTKGKSLHNVVIDKAEQTFTLPYTEELKSMVFDNQQMLLSKIRETKPAEQYRYQYQTSERYGIRKAGLIEGTSDYSLESQKLIVQALDDPFHDIRIIAIERCANVTDAMKNQAVEKIKMLAKSDSNSTVRVTALTFLNEVLKEDELTEIYKERIQKDKSYSVIISALRNLAKYDESTAINLAENLENEKSSSMISGIAQLYAANAGPEKYDFFKTAFEGNVVQGFDRLGLLSGFSFYLSSQEAAIINDGLKIYRMINEKGGYYEKMFLPQNISYVQQKIAKQKEEKQKELEEFEKNKDVALADQVRKQITILEATEEAYRVFATEIGAGKSN